MLPPYYEGVVSQKVGRGFTMGFCIKSGAKTRFPRYYTGPKELSQLETNPPVGDSGPFGGTHQLTRIGNEETALNIMDKLKELYEKNPKWDRTEIMNATIVPTVS